MLKQSLNQKLLQELSPQQIQFIKLLELNTLNFEQKIEEELIDNPALEQGREDEEFIPINAGITFRERLIEAVKPSLQTEQEYILADQIIGTLDDDGYLRRPLRSIVNDLLFSANVRTTEDELEAVLEKIQDLEPAGIGARSLQECLLLQIRS